MNDKKLTKSYKSHKSSHFLVVHEDVHLSCKRYKVEKLCFKGHPRYTRTSIHKHTVFIFVFLCFFLFFFLYFPFFIIFFIETNKQIKQNKKLKSNKNRLTQKKKKKNKKNKQTNMKCKKRNEINWRSLFPSKQETWRKMEVFLF